MDDMRAVSVTRRHALVAAVIVLLLLILVGRYVGRAPGRAPTQAQAAGGEVRVTAAPPAKLVVHVVGAVRRPGLYRLPDGSRFADAVKRAGGAPRRAQLELVNLAAPLADGVQVVIPRRPSPAAAGTGGGAGAESDPTLQGPVHLNTATLEQLDALPGVGPVTAQKILDYRDEHGAFSSVDELDAIPGIGPARLEQLRELVAP